MGKGFFTAFFVLALALVASARETLLADWEFSQNGRPWKAVVVPHDRAIAGPFDLEHDKQTVRIVENGDATSLEPFVRPQMKLFHGQLVAVFEGAGEDVTCAFVR